MDLISIAIARKIYDESSSAASLDMNYYFCSDGEYNSGGVPTVSNPDDKTFYIVPSSGSNGIYNVYVNKNNAWELFKSVSIDMSKIPVDNTLTLSGKAADAKKVGDEISDLKADLCDVNNELDTIGFICQSSSVIEKSASDYNYVGPFVFDTTKTYRIGITVETSGTYTVQVGERYSVSTMVDTLLSNATIEANKPLYLLYTPSASNLTVIRLSSNTVDWSASVAEMVKSGAFETQINELNSTVTELTDTLSETSENLTDLEESLYTDERTSQLFDDSQESLGHLYVKTDLSTVNNNQTVESWIVPIESGKRYVYYNTDISVLSSTIYERCFEFSQMPAVGVSAVNTIGSIINSGENKKEFTASVNGYLLITLFVASGTTISDDTIGVIKNNTGVEQIDDGFNIDDLPYYQKVAKYVDTADLRSSWYGKTIWWCGTSIPAGVDTAIGAEGNGRTYPEMVGDILGANVINVALGSSMCRANVRTGDYVHALSNNVLRSLTQTSAEKESMITNWSSIAQVLNDEHETLSASDIAVARGATFDVKLMPYLNGTRPMPDLFVFDHGHNDYKAYYTDTEGNPDIELEPTVENITNNKLAEDTYMTANNYTNLRTYYGNLSGIPQSKLDSFIASVNRNCFKGSINFLITLILSKNPRARILFIGNLDNWDKPGVIEAQEAIAKDWEFPIVEVWKSTGFSGHYIPGTADYWDENGTTDLTVKHIYCKDNIHPFSDTTGQAMNIYAKVIADAIEHIVI